VDLKYLSFCLEVIQIFNRFYVLLSAIVALASNLHKFPWLPVTKEIENRIE
jgi:hypothetical protein